jgi:ribonuclease R
MKDKIGEEYEGIISGVAAFGFFVELKDIFVEGLVRMTSLHDDYYQYHEKKYCLVGERTHKTFRIGDEVRVRVDRVDVESRHIDFGLIEKKDRVTGR